MKVKICIKCKEYISIHENTYLGHQRLKIFENTHMKHPLVTVDSSEIFNYKNVNTKIDKFIVPESPT